MLYAKGSSVTIVADGFSVASGAGRHDVRWGDITRVEAGNVDCFVYDDIRLAFWVGESADPTFIVSEEVDEFSGLSRALERALGIDGSWYAEITSPAFASNHRVLFSARTSR